MYVHSLKMSPKYMKYEPHQHFSQTFSIWRAQKTNRKQEVRRPSAQQQSILERVCVCVWG